MNQTLSPESVMQLAPVLPVVTIEDASKAEPLARALIAGGINTIEVTLRTSAALEAIRAIAAAEPHMIVGAGTVITAEDLDAAIEAGARYALSPGGTPKLMKAARKRGIPFIPGVASASEVMRAMELGYTHFKLFPAEQAGGVDMLKALHAPLPRARFCPTGGVRAETAASFLALPNVVCVGGSWIAPADKIRAGDWGAIEKAAKAAAALRR